MADEPLKCALCRRPRELDEMHVMRITEAERVQMVKMGATPQAEYAYCRPCWAILSNRNGGPKLIRGMVLARMNAIGHPDAEKIAEQVYTLLLKGSTKGPVS